MEDAMRRLIQAQQHIRKVISEEALGCVEALLRDASSRESFLRFVAGMGIDPSQIPSPYAQPGGYDPYLVFNLDRSAPDEEVRRRYRELLKKLHPDTAGGGAEFLLQIVIGAYRQIAKERGWQQ